MGKLLSMEVFDIVYWGQEWHRLRKEGNYKRADELKEMIRRIGFELRVTKKGYEIIPVYKSYE